MNRRVTILFTKLIVNTLALIVVSAIFEGIRVENNDPWIFAAVAITLALINTYLKPIVVILTLPFNILTLGLLTLLINAFLLKLASWIIPAFHVEGFWTAVWAALVMSVISILLNWFLKPPRTVVRIER